jgi:hypothetical protein
MINWFSNCTISLNLILPDLDGFKNIITIPPNFDNNEIKAKFNSTFLKNINFYIVIFLSFESFLLFNCYILTPIHI